MVKIVIENLGKKELEVNNISKTVLNHIQDHFVDWMHACGAKGRCTTCKMEVLEGGEGLSGLTESELRYRQKGELLAHERLACQVSVSGNLVIRVPESGKLPHMTYS